MKSITLVIQTKDAIELLQGVVPASVQKNVVKALKNPKEKNYPIGAAASAVSRARPKASVEAPAKTKNAAPPTTASASN